MKTAVEGNLARKVIFFGAFGGKNPIQTANLQHGNPGKVTRLIPVKMIGLELPKSGSDIHEITRKSCFSVP
jgi:hypothetical protein